MNPTLKTLLLALASTVALAGITLAGTVEGRVTFDGDAPRQKPLRMAQDDYCVGFYKGKDAPVSESTVVNEDGSLRWVFVYIAEKVDGDFKAPSEPVDLDQSGCMYEPHVLGMMAGQELVVKNSDETKHNFHLLGRNQYNRSASPGNSVERKVRKPGTLAPKKGRSRLMDRIKCDVHPWMAAFVGVLPHPFFSVTGEHGQFSIAGLPPGSYTLVAWHEKLGTQVQEISVSGDGTQTVDFTFKSS